MSVDFVHDVGELSLKDKQMFYLLFANNLTTSIRMVFASETLCSGDKSDYVKCLNEVMHRVLNRLYDLEFGNGSWNETDIWGMIKNAIRNNRIETQKYVGGAICDSLTTVKAKRGKGVGPA